MPRSRSLLGRATGDRVRGKGDGSRFDGPAGQAERNENRADFHQLLIVFIHVRFPFEPYQLSQDPQDPDSIRMSIELKNDNCTVFYKCSSGLHPMI